MQPQPAEGWHGVTSFCGWEEVPSVYLVCENDCAIPVGMQVSMARAAGSRIERCGAGHMVMLSMPERVVEVVRGFVGE